MIATLHTAASSGVASFLENIICRVKGYFFCLFGLNWKMCLDSELSLSKAGTLKDIQGIIRLLHSQNYFVYT